MTHILIAEDEGFIANLYKRNLEAEKMSVTVSRDGKEALEELQKARPDLLLLDLLMPETDGFAVLAWIKRNRKKGYDMPVIVLTNLGQKLNQKKCMQMGAAGYIVKSDVDVENVVALVRKHLQK